MSAWWLLLWLGLDVLIGLVFMLRAFRHHA